MDGLITCPAKSDVVQRNKSTQQNQYLASCFTDLLLGLCIAQTNSTYSTDVTVRALCRQSRGCYLSIQVDPVELGVWHSNLFAAPQAGVLQWASDLVGGACSRILRVQALTRLSPRRHDYHSDQSTAHLKEPVCTRPPSCFWACSPPLQCRPKISHSREQWPHQQAFATAECMNLPSISVRQPSMGWLITRVPFAWSRFSIMLPTRLWWQKMSGQRSCWCAICIIVAFARRTCFLANSLDKENPDHEILFVIRPRAVNVSSHAKMMRTRMTEYQSSRTEAGF